MRKIFRFFRGELNGFFIYIFVTFLNHYIELNGMLDELVYHTLVQWKLEDEVTINELPMRDSDIMGIGKIGGLFSLRTNSNTNLGSIWFTRPYLVEGVQRSERGLLDMDYESFMFVRVNQDEYTTDIGTTAGERRRMSYVEHGAVPLGYVKEGTELFTFDGKVNDGTEGRPNNLLSAPPTDGSFIEWYGLKYLWFEEFFDLELPLSIDVYKKLFEALQVIRRNGPNTKSFMDITLLMGEGYMHNIDIRQNGYYYDVYYSLDDEVTVYNRERRYVAWQEAVKMKFKYFNLYDRDKGEH